MLRLSGFLVTVYSLLVARHTERSRSVVACYSVCITTLLTSDSQLLTFSIPTNSPFLIYFNKIIHRPVITSFHIVWKIAGRKLSHTAMISYTIATYSFFAAWIGAIAIYFVLVCFTFFHFFNLNFGLTK